MMQRQVFPALTLRAVGLACGRGGMALCQDLNFTLEAGKCLLLRGPNGTGKTTLILTLAGMVSPLAGSLVLEGHDEDMGPALHYCGHRNAIKQRLSVLENLTFWASLNGPTGLAPQEALERVGLGGISNLDAGYLSAGQGRRLALARLLVSQRPVWLLDEPTAALDTQGHALVGSLIDAHLEQGGIVVAATHDPITPTDLTRVEVLALGQVA